MRHWGFSWLAFVTLASFTSTVFADDAASTKKDYYSTVGEGKTLPTGVARFRFPYQTASGSETYDKDGNKTSLPYQYSATGGAFVFEYGISEKLSLQIKTDYYLSQKITANTSSDSYNDLKSAQFAKATGGAKNATELSSAMAAQLANNATARGKLCGAVTAAQCTASIAAGSVTNNSGVAIPVTTGVNIANGQNVKTVLDSYSSTVDQQITDGLNSAIESNGGRGVGDTIAGILYDAYDDHTLAVGLGGGIRLPSGNRDLGVGEQPTTRGAWEAGVRLNIDYLPINWFMLSWQNQSEVGFMGVTRKEAAAGDQTIKYHRDGVRNVGFVYLKPSLGGISDSLGFIATRVGVTYDYDSAVVTKVGDSDEVKGTRSAMMWSYAGLGFDFLPWSVPVQFDIEHETPMRGKNTSVAATKDTFTLKGYMKF